MVRALVLAVLALCASSCDILFGTFFPNQGAYLVAVADVSALGPFTSNPSLETVEFYNSQDSYLVIRKPQSGVIEYGVYDANTLEHFKNFNAPASGTDHLIGANGGSFYIGNDQYDKFTLSKTYLGVGPIVNISNYRLQKALHRFNGTTDWFYFMMSDYELNYVEFSFSTPWNSGQPPISQNYPADGNTRRALKAVQKSRNSTEAYVLSIRDSSGFELFYIPNITVSGNMTQAASYPASFDTDSDFSFLTRNAVILAESNDGLDLRAYDFDGNGLGSLFISESDRHNSSFHFDNRGKYWYQLDRVKEKLYMYRTWW